MKNKGLKAVVAAVLVLAAGAGGVFSYLYTHGMSGLHHYTEPKSDDIRIACVGDSVTYGHGISSWSKNNYPAVLQSLLGDGYCVQNFGESGATVQDTGDQPYTSYKPYAESLKYDADTVVIMMGSNDSKPENWKGEEAFKQHYRKLIDYYNKDGKKLYICTPASTYYPEGKPQEGLMAYDIQGDIVDELTQYVRDIAEEYEIEVIDIHSLTANARELFSFDGVHPNAEGACAIANAVFEAIV